MTNCRQAVKELFKEDLAIPQKRVAISEQEDGYFSTYTHFSIHEEMLKVVVTGLTPKGGGCGVNT